MRILLLVTDAFGGRGGIAYYNRCLAEALAEIPEVSNIEVVPRLIPEPPVAIPDKVRVRTAAGQGKLRYAFALTSDLFRSANLVICGHINLLPVAAILALAARRPLVLQVHGIEVWNRPPVVQRMSMHAVDRIWSVSEVTRDKMNMWAAISDQNYNVIPNTIRLSEYGVKEKRRDLIARYGLEGKKVIFTLARLSAREQYKGIDTVLECLSRLAILEPSIRYVIGGEGDDRGRLEAKAATLGVTDKVAFVGYVSERDKKDMLRLADVFAMPGWGEGFGVVYLEAMACGVPVIGSRADGSREALRNGMLGDLVEPGDHGALISSICRALNVPRAIPHGLEYFDWDNYVQRIRCAVRQLMQR